MTKRNEEKERKKHMKHFAGALRVRQVFGAAWYGYSPWSLGNPAQHERLKAKTIAGTFQSVIMAWYLYLTARYCSSLPPNDFCHY